MRPLRCPVCHGSDVETIFTWDGLPAFCNVLHQTREQALATERAAMRLMSCRRCGFIHNAAFEPEKIQYGPHYGNPLSASPHFRRYATGVVEELIRRHNLHGREIIEIGCGDGYFLRLLCDLGQNRGIGFDPSYDADSVPPNQDASEVKIIADIYSQKYEHYRPAMVCCRHVLEHIPDPLGFLKGLRGMLDGREECIVFFEVPDARHTFQRGAVWDILYEHCNYFTRESLRWVFEAAGFHVVQTNDRYGGQFLTIEARPAGVSGGRGADSTTGRVDTQSVGTGFQSSFLAAVDSWRERIATWQKCGQRVVTWGAGTKGTTFLNVLAISHDALEYVVDIHPKKQGKFLPGTGQEIVAPESLAVYRPDAIIVMNPLYLREIQDMTLEHVTDTLFVAASNPSGTLPVACSGATPDIHASRKSRTTPSLRQPHATGCVVHTGSTR